MKSFIAKAQKNVRGETLHAKQLIKTRPAKYKKIRSALCPKTRIPQAVSRITVSRSSEFSIVRHPVDRPALGAQTHLGRAPSFEGVRKDPYGTVYRSVRNTEYRQQSGNLFLRGGVDDDFKRYSR